MLAWIYINIITEQKNVLDMISNVDVMFPRVENMEIYFVYITETTITDSR